MTLHHVIDSSAIDPLKQACIYCTEISDTKWGSEFSGEHHYKTFVCEHCHAKNFVEVEFHGSGHDGFGIEKKVK